jgi:hypothetical protein
MTLERLTGLLAVLAWPIVALVVVAFLRREIIGLFGRVREIEGPGDLKVSLDPSKVEKIYRAALNSLTTKGYIRKTGKGYALSEEGRRVTREYLLGVFQGLSKS